MKPSQSSSFFKTKVELYDTIYQHIHGLFSDAPHFPTLSKLSSLIALLKELHPKISWCGAYLLPDYLNGENLHDLEAYGPGFKPGTLLIGPYQGKIACLEIPPGKGVCGVSFKEKKTLIVPDVNLFAGHIACDALSRSEIVVPIYDNGVCIGVLDCDSYEENAFNEDDQIGIEKILNHFFK